MRHGCYSVDKKLCYKLCVMLGGTTLASREFLSNLPEFFPWPVSVRAAFGACFFEMGVLWACLGFFDLRVFACG